MARGEKRYIIIHVLVKNKKLEKFLPSEGWLNPNWWIGGLPKKSIYLLEGMKEYIQFELSEPVQFQSVKGIYEVSGKEVGILYRQGELSQVAHFQRNHPNTRIHFQEIANSKEGTVESYEVVKGIVALNQKEKRNQERFQYLIQEDLLHKLPSLHQQCVYQLIGAKQRTRGEVEKRQIDQVTLMEDVMKFCISIIQIPRMIQYYIYYKKEFLNIDVSVEEFCRQSAEGVKNYFTVLPEEREVFFQVLNDRLTSFWVNPVYSPYEGVIDNSVKDADSIRNALERSRILTFHDSPTLPLTGKGVIVGIVDSGIDYLHPLFISKEGETKIFSIWDQTSKGNPPRGLFYGTEYTKEQIQKAIGTRNEGGDPYSVVPSKDETGTGTYLAGVAAGFNKGTLYGEYVGAAPEAEIAVVKVKPSFQFVQRLYNIPNPTVPLYFAVDVMAGIQYLYQLGKRLDKPVVILMGLGTNQGPHNRYTINSAFLSLVGIDAGSILVNCAGDEGSSQRHYRGTLINAGEKVSMSMRVAPGETNFILNIWAKMGDRISISITSPGGESTGILQSKRFEVEEVKLLLETTNILVVYNYIDRETGQENIMISFDKVDSGVWNIDFIAEEIVSGIFDVYLPRTGWIKDETILLDSDAKFTVVEPTSTSFLIGVSAYDVTRNSLYPEASRGFTRCRGVEPWIVAPGVNILGPTPGGDYVTKSGTAVAAAIVGGACALLAQWGMQFGQSLSINTPQAKGYLALGAKQNPQIDYPNENWGYGELDLENIFNSLR